MSSPSEIIYTIAVWLLPVLFAITMHEAAHGWVASRLGDPTARQLGRISINPLRHIDVVGTVIVPMVTFFLSGFIFGWAKPVPINPRYFKQPLLDMAVVAAAGPASNFIMGCAWALFGFLSLRLLGHSQTGVFLYEMGKSGILINVILMVLNLIPIPPLDGGRVLAGILPPQLAVSYMKLEPFGMIIIVLLLISGMLGTIMWPMVLYFSKLIGSIFGI